MTSHPESEKLRECPLCGSHVRSGYYEHDYGGYGWVACMGDKCGIQVEDETETRAIRRWNTRHPSQYREALEGIEVDVTAGDMHPKTRLRLIHDRVREALASPQGDGWTHTHVKRGTHYRMIRDEKAKWEPDWSDVVIYESASGIWVVRDKAEFNDGRFIPYRRATREG